ncbi:hypothetical protein PSP6_700024 [Paraburkholderia tropica]|nr:hypothetical protein PSP6_700024 [Paraburkholderia tropica]
MRANPDQCLTTKLPIPRIEPNTQMPWQVLCLAVGS